jgi:hypothetical protein
VGQRVCVAGGAVVVVVVVVLVGPRLCRVGRGGVGQPSGLIVSPPKSHVDCFPRGTRWPEEDSPSYRAADRCISYLC